MTFNREEFEKEKSACLLRQNQDKELQTSIFNFITKIDKYNYEYQWTWMGIPIIKMPEDIILTQQIIYDTKPDYIIETGIAWGGSVVYYASLLQLLGNGEIIAIDTILPKKISIRLWRILFQIVFIY
jgi:cephalosporin hydroxylase